jgi:membrane-associated phospholipid phosphatase
MFTIDQNVTNSVGRNSVMTINNDFWDIPTIYGTIPFSAALSSVTYFTGLFINNESIKTTGMLMGEALLISGSAIFIIRYLTGRARPHYNEGAWKFHGFKIDREFQSFPSGHTNLAFVLSTVLAERLDSFWARLVLYGFAGLTAAAQVLNNQHFLSDVVVGGLFGFGTGMYVLNKEKNRVNDQRNSSIRFIPSQDGISLIITF